MNIICARCREHGQLLHKMTPAAFEALVGELLSKSGYEDVEVIGRSGDGGVDVRARLTANGIADVEAAIQVKRYQANVQVATIRELRGSLDPAEIGVIITTSDFSVGAKAEAQHIVRKPIKLINGNDLVELLVQQDIGVAPKSYTVLELRPEFLELVTEKADAQVEAMADQAIDLAGPSGTTPKDTLPLRRAEIDLPDGTLLRAEVKNQVYDAVVLAGKVRYNDQIYSSPSAAALAVTGWSAANGWAFWQYQDPTTQNWLPLAQARKAKK